MKHVEQLVSIFLNVHEVVAFVWVWPRCWCTTSALAHKMVDLGAH
jgi:hypothetical protein